MNPILEFFLQNILPPLATGFGAWVFAMKRQRAQTKASELENVEKALSIYRGMIEDLNKEIKELHVEIKNMAIQNTELKQEMEELKASNNALKRALNKQKQNA